MTYQPVSLIPDPASNRVWDNMRRIAEWTRERGGRLASDAPATATAAGAEGEVRFDDSYLYVCVAKDTWKRTSLSSW
jgi:hypothetical protein